MPPLLTQDEVNARLAQLAGWEQSGIYITQTFNFLTFKASISFVNQVAKAAEEMDHHPDIVINYARVVLSITTYSEGGLTRRDFRLAKKINGLASD